MKIHHIFIDDTVQAFIRLKKLHWYCNVKNFSIIHRLKIFLKEILLIFKKEFINKNAINASAKSCKEKLSETYSIGKIFGKKNISGI